MSKKDHFDITYLTIDSIAEGVGSSQIKPLLRSLSDKGLKINLISYEKNSPSVELEEFFQHSGISWSFSPFGNRGLFGGVDRLNSLRKRIPPSELIHARSDIPAAAAILSHQAPVLWDVRSLWADQKIRIQDTVVNKLLYNTYISLEKLAAAKSDGMSTLTNAIVPILQERNKRLPALRTVVSTTVDLERFKFSSMLRGDISVLFSGTYNEYYDLNLSKKFVQEMQNRADIQVHWARPIESDRRALDVGETKVFSADQVQMASIIPQYSLGMSVCKLDSGPSLAAAMPTKIGEFLACGRPIVVNKGLGDMDRIMEDSSVGVALDGTKENLIQSVERMLEILADPETPYRCRDQAEKHFNMEIGAQRYLSLYQDILDARRTT
jgi:hypothetical protein